MGEMKLPQKEKYFKINIPLLLLFTACVMIFRVITLEYRGYHLAENYLTIPSILFLGYMLREKASILFTKPFLLAAAMVCWYVIADMIHKLWGQSSYPMGVWCSVYLLAWPFAVWTEDRNHTGLRMVGSMFLAASLILVIFSLLLILDQVPASLADSIFWDDTRLYVMHHPNVTACYLMIGTGFSLIFYDMTRTKLVRAALVAAIALQIVAMALTNGRAVILMTGATLGGTLFFRIFKGDWKSFLLGLVVVVLVIAGFYMFSREIFLWNHDRLNALKPDTLQAAEKHPGILLADSSLRSLGKDIKNLNRRTETWKTVLQVLRSDKSILLWGTSDPGVVITQYNPFMVGHTHNSWLEILMFMGIPGLVMALAFTVIALFCSAKLMLSPEAELWKRIVVMMVVCLLTAGFIDPYLFICYRMTDFAFFLLIGYLYYWCSSLPRQKSTM